jgi:hypothetical protein
LPADVKIFALSHGKKAQKANEEPPFENGNGDLWVAPRYSLKGPNGERAWENRPGGAPSNSRYWNLPILPWEIKSQPLKSVKKKLPRPIILLKLSHTILDGFIVVKKICKSASLGAFAFLIFKTRRYFLLVITFTYSKKVSGAPDSMLYSASGNDVS